MPPDRIELPAFSCLMLRCLDYETDALPTELRGHTLVIVTSPSEISVGLTQWTGIASSKAEHEQLLMNSTGIECCHLRESAWRWLRHCYDSICASVHQLQTVVVVVLVAD